MEIALKNQEAEATETTPPPAGTNNDSRSRGASGTSTASTTTQPTTIPQRSTTPPQRSTAIPGPGQPSQRSTPQPPTPQPPVPSPAPRRNWAGKVSAIGDQASWKYEDKSPEKGIYFNDEKNRLEIDGVEAPEEVKQQVAEHYLADKDELDHPAVKKFFATLDKPPGATGKTESEKGAHGADGAGGRPTADDTKRVSDLMANFKDDSEHIEKLKAGLAQIYKKTDKTEVTFVPDADSKALASNGGRYLYVFVKSEGASQKRMYPYDLKQKKLLIGPGVAISGKEKFE